MSESLNVEEIFLTAMGRIGAVKPSELAEEVNGTKNADFVLEADNVVGEIKCLMEDPRDHKQFNETYLKMYMQWVADGRVPAPKSEKIKINTADLPPDCAHEFLRRISRRVKKDVTSGNRQIRDLKGRLNMHSANGLLVLCNTGNAFLQPDVILYELHHALSDRHTSINWLLYFTCGLPIQRQGQQPAEIFAFAQREGYDNIPAALATRIKNAWLDCIACTQVERPNDHSILFDAKHE